MNVRSSFILFVRYWIASFWSVAAQTAIFMGLVAVHVQPLLASQIAFFSHAVLKFIFQKWWTFKNSSISGRDLLWQVGAYAVLEFLNFYLNTWLFTTLSKQWHWLPLAAQLTCSVVLGIWSFVITWLILKKPTQK